jgi:hypothetical protein
VRRPAVVLTLGTGKGLSLTIIIARRIPACSDFYDLW